MAPQMIQAGISDLCQRTYLVLHEDEYVTSYEADRGTSFDDLVHDVFSYCNGRSGGEFQGKDLVIWRGDGRLSAVIRRNEDGTSQVTRFLA